jgi:DNA-binding transcriptional LysR family regulator
MVRMAELAAETFVDFPVGYGIRSVVDRAFAAANVPRHVSLEVADIATGADCVRHGLGIGFLPRFIIPDHPGLHTLTVKDAELRWPMAVASSTTRSLNAAPRALLELIQGVPALPAGGEPAHLIHRLEAR